jgi:uncharacterized membrane protein YkoI
MTSIRRSPGIVIAFVFFCGIATAKTKIEGSISLKGKLKGEYSSLAKISLQEAIAIAMKQTSGNVAEAALEQEDGFLVYEVEIQPSGSRKKEFLIDAGNGNILHVKEPSAKTDGEND